MDRHIRLATCLYLQSLAVQELVTIYLLTQYNIPEDSNLHWHYCHNLKPQKCGHICTCYCFNDLAYQHPSEASVSTEESKKPTRCHLIFYCTSYRLNMFQALLCPSSGARDYDVVCHVGRVVLGLLYVGGEVLLGWSSVRVAWACYPDTTQA